MTIQEAIKSMAQSGTEIYSKVCVVDSIDEDARTIDCSPIDDSSQLLGVNLQANQESKEGFVMFPEVGSYVVVSFINQSVAVAVLFEKLKKATLKIGDMTLEVSADRIVINGGDFGGLIKINDLTKKINELIMAFNNHTHELPVGSVAVVGSATAQANPSIVGVPPILLKHSQVSVSDYENEKVKH